MQHILTQPYGWVLLSLFGLFMIIIAYIASRRHVQTREEFLVARREMHTMPMAMSIAASWIWAPALFVAAQKSYQLGAAGLFWYCTPNFLTLVVFGAMALTVRRRLPLGYTFPQYIRSEYGRGVHVLYLIQFYFLQICCFAVQLFAGASLMETVSGIPFVYTAVFLATLVVVYATFGGLRASVATDYAQMLVILSVLAIVIPWAVYKTGGSHQILAGLGGIGGQYRNIFDPWVAYSFGIPITISLMSGPIGDQMHWQRGYAIGNDSIVKRAYLIGAVLFILVPLSLGQLGFLAAAEHMQFTNGVSVQMVGPALIAKHLPSGVLILFTVMVLAGLCSTLDSVLCAVSSLTITDLMTNEKLQPESHFVLIGRISMVVVAALGVAIALITRSANLRIEDLFIFYGTWRASTMIPTYVTLLHGPISSKRVFASIIASMLTGAPLIAYGKLSGSVNAEVAGGVSVLLIGTFLCVSEVIASRANRLRQNPSGV